jgi:hypothetical protein
LFGIKPVTIHHNLVWTGDHNVGDVRIRHSGPSGPKPSVWSGGTNHYRVVCRIVDAHTLVCISLDKPPLYAVTC